MEQHHPPTQQLRPQVEPSQTAAPQAGPPAGGPPDGGVQQAVTVRYWAAARAVAGLDNEVLGSCATVRDAISEMVRRHPELHRVTAVSTLLLDGRPVSRDQALPDGAILEVLPPFAGG